MSTLSDIRNFVQLTETVGTAGQPRPEQFDLLAGSFDAVINLAMSDHDDAVSNEGAIVSSHGMSYHHIPVPWTAPEPQHASLFCSLMDALQERRVFVHCVMNFRVSAFMYLYLKFVRGVDESHCRSPIFDMWTPEGVWAEVMSWTAEDLNLQTRR